MRDRTNISDALENHEENKNKDLSSTICEFVSLECTPQVRYTVSACCLVLETRVATICYFFTSSLSGSPCPIWRQFRGSCKGRYIQER